MPTTAGIPARPGTLPEGPSPGDTETPAIVTPGGGAASARPDAVRRGAELRPVLDAIEQHRDALLAKPHVLHVRPGYKFEDGRITDTPAIVVVVDRKVAGLRSQDQIPKAIGGILTDVAPADPFERVRLRAPGMEAGAAAPKAPRLLIDELQPFAGDEAFEEAAPRIAYTPPEDGDLRPVTGAMTVTCHVSPDAGWKVLQPFLAEASREVYLGMYDFTAPHIYQAARAALKKESVRWRQTLGPKESLPAETDVDSTKADDLTEKQVTRGLRRVGGDRFETEFAHVGAGLTFASAYHIKVAVRDKEATWLSSGNWQSSNQPDIDFLDADADVSLITRYNREWHVVVEDPALARVFRTFLDHDLKTARAPVPEAAALPQRAPDLLIPVDEFLREERARPAIEVFAPQKFSFSEERPLTVHPILTPDNYVEIVLDLLRKRPAERLYFQNQSLNPVLKPEPGFAELMQLLADYSQDDNLDVRLIFRNIGPVRKKLESLQAAGFNMKRVRMQAGCHTKGIIVDSRTVLIGSHNMTNQGVLVNRDASVLIRHEGIARYYERVFLHDWEQLSKDTIREEAVPIPAGADEAAELDADGYVRVPWSFIEED